MTHQFNVAGMTCASCVDKVRAAIEKVPGVRSFSAKPGGEVWIGMDRHIPLEEFQEALRATPRYQISEAESMNVQMPTSHAHREETEKKPFWQVYKPILMVFGYITGVTLLVEIASGAFEPMRWMRYFMAGFFLVFSFFKLLDVPAFASSYASYDLLTRRWPAWGYIYPFVELLFGVLYLIDFDPWITNSLALVVMSVSTVGVIQALSVKRKFQCACLGTVFNLPMSQITLVEDLLMVLMSAGMMFLHL